MLSTEISFAPGRCPVTVRCEPRGGASLASVIRTVGPLLFLTVDPLILLAVAVAVPIAIPVAAGRSYQALSRSEHSAQFNFPQLELRSIGYLVVI